MKRLPISALALLAVLATGCTTPAYENNHWHINSVGPRISYHFLGYTQSTDGAYSDLLLSQGDDILLTVRRHMLNNNPENPFTPLPVQPPYRPTPPDVEFTVNHR